METVSRRSRTLIANLRYLWALLKRFRVTFLLLVAVLFGGTLAFWAGYSKNGQSITLPKALAATCFLMMGQTSLELPDSWAMTLVFVLIPILGLAVVADGLVRFGYLFFAKHRNDKEWVAVQAQSFKDHVVVCGAGRVGFRVLDQLSRMGVDVVVVERNENAPFVQAIRGQGVPILIDDVREASALEATNIRAARAIVCATDDDLANLNIALDARRINPGIRVVMRLFDDDLVAKVRDTFKVQAMSTSALAAPAFAAAAVDPSIHTSFELDGEIMVVGEVAVGAHLAGRTAAELHDQLGATLLRVKRGEAGFREVGSAEPLRDGDVALLQATLERYRALQASLGAERRSA
jgi:Trk K+ transport system NAD-binding subunit